MFVNKSGPTVCIDKKQEARSPLQQYLYSSHTYLITPPINTRYPTRYPIAFRRQVFALRKTREVQVQVQRFHFYWKTTDSEVAHLTVITRSRTYSISPSQDEPAKLTNLALLDPRRRWKGMGSWQKWMEGTARRWWVQCAVPPVFIMERWMISSNQISSNQILNRFSFSLMFMLINVLY